MKYSNPGRLIILAAVAAAIFSGSPIGAAEGERGTVEKISVSSGESGTVIYVKTSIPVPVFECRLGSAGAREVTLELPSARSLLEEHYQFDSREISEATVDAGSNGHPGVRIRFVLKHGALSKI